MITAPATASDFNKWEAHAATCDALSLRHIIKDCQQAAAGMRGWNPSREGYYLDQSYTYSAELSRRKA